PREIERHRQPPAHEKPRDDQRGTAGGSSHGASRASTSTTISSQASGLAQSSRRMQKTCAISVTLASMFSLRNTAWPYRPTTWRTCSSGMDESSKGLAVWKGCKEPDSQALCVEKCVRPGNHAGGSQATPSRRHGEEMTFVWNEEWCVNPT